VRAGRSSGASHSGDCVTLVDPLPFLHKNAGHVSISGDETVEVKNLDEISKVAAPACESYNALLSSKDRSSRLGSYVDSLMHAPAPPSEERRREPGLRGLAKHFSGSGRNSEGLPDYNGISMQLRISLLQHRNRQSILVRDDLQRISHTDGMLSGLLLERDA